MPHRLRVPKQARRRVQGGNLVVLRAQTSGLPRQSLDALSPIAESAGKSWSCTRRRRYPRMLMSLARVQVLILDDWGIAPLTAEQRRDLLEIVDDCHGPASTIVTSQLPVAHRHEHIGSPTIADAVLDRLVHTAHRIELKGESLRKLRATKPAKSNEPTAARA
jgi:IstB-like ATP binding protein